MGNRKVLRTERLYYTDCSLREFEARVLKVEPVAQGFGVYLDRTAFYPESGGQLNDRGTLGGLPVLVVLDEGETIAHLLAYKPQGEVLKGEIDWTRRFDHMQQHTGQHLLSAAFEKTGEYKTVSFHMGEEVSTIDLDSDRVGQRQIDEAEELANRAVFENREVRIFFRPAAETIQMDIRKPTARQGDVRLVEVEGFDLSACGGTHVSRTGAIGLILARKFERIKAHTRVEFVCGSRALKTARQDYRTLSEAARILSAASENVPDLIRKQSGDLRTAFRHQTKQIERLAEYKARELWLSAKERNGRKIIRHVFAADEGQEAKAVAHAIARLDSSVGLIGVQGKPITLYFAQSTGGGFDMGAILKQTVARFGGKGGGTRDFAQGGGLEEDKLEEALAFAESLL